MKNLVITGLILILSFLLMINNPGFIDEKFYPDKPNPDNHNSVRIEEQLSTYDFDVEYFTMEGRVRTVQKIKWYNSSNEPADKIYLCLPLNAYKNNNTSFFNGTGYKSSMKTGYAFYTVELNGESVELVFGNSDQSINDSTIAALNLHRVVNRGDSVNILLEYVFTIPSDAHGLGYSKGNTFCMLADWHPYVTKFENGEWQKHDYEKYTKPEAEYFKFSGRLKTDSNLTVAASADMYKGQTGSANHVFHFNQNTSKQLSFAFFDHALLDTLRVEHHTGQTITVEIFLLEENKRYLERIKKAAKYSIDFLADYLGEYPSSHLSIVNVPNKNNFGFNSYADLITVYCDLFSPESILNPEYDLSRMIAKQYFENYLSIIDTEDAWIVKGVPRYLAGLITDKHYPDPLIHFRLAGYVPIYGLNLLSYNEIPIIYTLKEFNYDSRLRDISYYYQSLNHNKIIDSRFYKSSENVKANLGVKPSLILNSLTAEVGSEAVLASLKDIYTSAVSGNRTNRFIENFNEEAGKFLDASFGKSVKYDYAVIGLSKVNSDEYVVEASRLGDGICPVTIYLYSETDTLHSSWDGVARNIRIKFKSENEVYAAEIVPGYAELMDINQANNSYTIESKYWGSLSIAMRAFFWFQNALMIFGSIG